MCHMGNACGHCPECGGFVISDYNDMPQSAWQSDDQEWHCDGCGQPVVRHFNGARWSKWQKR